MSPGPLSPRPPRAPALGVAVVASALLAAPTAVASEGQWRLGAGLGTSSFVDGPGGPAAAVVGGWEPSDMFDLRLQLTSRMPGFSFPRRATNLAVGALYKLDVIEVVPYIGVMAVWHQHGPARPLGVPESELGLAVPLGLDWSLDRSLSLGVELRYDGFGSSVPTSLGGAAELTAMAFVSHRFGW